MGGIFDDSPSISGGTDNTTIGNDGDSLKVSSYQGGVWSLGRTWTLLSGTDSVSAVQSGVWNIGTLTSITNPVAVTQSTSPWVISGTVTAAEDKNFGTVGANTLRSAAQIGNATGAADFNAGNSSAQTLRVVVASNQVVIPVGGNVASGATDSGNPVKIGAVFLTTQPTVTNGQRVNLQATNRGALIVSTGVDAFNINNVTGTISLPTGAATAALQTTGNTSLASIDTKLVQLALNYGVATGALRVAAQVGNATGVADFNAGTTGAQTLRVVLPTDQTAIPVTQSTSPWVISGTVTASEDKNYGTVGANTLRVASQIGNATGAADFNAGATGAQTLRTHANQGAPNTVANAWPTRITDGTDSAKVTTNSDLSVSDGLRNGGVQGAITLTVANTSYEAKVGVSRLANRKSLVVTAISANMFWGYDSSVTTANGTPLVKGQQAVFAVDPDSTFQVWLVSSTAAATARIAESP